MFYRYLRFTENRNNKFADDAKRDFLWIYVAWIVRVSEVLNHVMEFVKDYCFILEGGSTIETVFPLLLKGADTMQ